MKTSLNHLISRTAEDLNQTNRRNIMNIYFMIGGDEQGDDPEPPKDPK